MIADDQCTGLMLGKQGAERHNECQIPWLALKHQ